MWPSSPSRMEDVIHPDPHREPVVSVRATYPPSSFGSLELTHVDLSLDPAASSAGLDLIYVSIDGIRVHFCFFCVAVCSPSPPQPSEWLAWFKSLWRQISNFTAQPGRRQKYSQRNYYIFGSYSTLRKIVCLDDSAYNFTVFWEVVCCFVFYHVVAKISCVLLCCK